MSLTPLEQEVKYAKLTLVNYIKRLTWTLASLGEYLTLQYSDVKLKPDIILGGIPIFNVTKEGHAASDEILKYRSMGGIFLAHQKGGKKTFKFTAKVFGPYRLALVSALQALQKSGTQQLIDIKKYAGNYITDKVPESVKINPLISYVKNDNEINEVFFHNTIPIITDSKIYMNMYLETLIVIEDVRLGLNCMEIQCAFREYVPPTRLELGKEDEKNKGYYSVFSTKKNVERYEVIDLMLNMAFASRDLAEVLYKGLNDKLGKKEKGMYEYELFNIALGMGFMASI